MGAAYVFFNETATTEIYTLSLHDALPISATSGEGPGCPPLRPRPEARPEPARGEGTGSFCCLRAAPPSADRKSTRLNSSHANISYAVFCLKKTTPHSF